MILKINGSEVVKFNNNYKAFVFENNFVVYKIN